jgi:hypothetical protein
MQLTPNKIKEGFHNGVGESLFKVIIGEVIGHPLQDQSRLQPANDIIPY